MRGNQNKHKSIIFANWKEVLATVIMFHFAINLAFGEDENETEFCRRQWSELVNDKKEWNNQCLHKNTVIKTPCCVATTGYIEQRYQNYIRWCPIVGKFLTSAHYRFDSKFESIESFKLIVTK